MSRDSDRTYHELRSRQETLRAEEAVDEAIASAHRELAALHRRKMMEIVSEPVLQLQPVTPSRGD